ncbi:hypothetical protein ILUMI_21038 [Ignelater luminosus]|uniref:DDE-1 domain-containing protein n=1 Tax=Ignelater luminosus TaxID=2038154 RepID=A0A8K0G400_IGNLU|nr:hypothetical protein ILUMI_21038 [Ignelater luminosus]
MPRYYKRIKDQEFNPDDMKQAIIDVLDNNMSVRNNAQKKPRDQKQAIQLCRKAHDVGFNNLDFSPNYRQAQVFSSEMKSALEAYLLKCLPMFYGLRPKLVRRLAYDFAIKNSLKVNGRWLQDKTATEDWFCGFMRYHPMLSVRTPEATGLARMTSFNKATVKVFQDKLEQVISRYSFTTKQIFNLDEARIMKGITDTCPLGLVYLSGWMTCANFLKALEHFVKHVRCSQGEKVLLIMDNHESHLPIDAVAFCRANEIVILTLPPRTSNKLQPLDRTVFGPFKSFFNQAADAWMFAHPGQTLSIYDLPLQWLLLWDRAVNPVQMQWDCCILSEEEFIHHLISSSKLSDNEITPPAISGKTEKKTFGKNRLSEHEFRLSTTNRSKDFPKDPAYPEVKIPIKAKKLEHIEMFRKHLEDVEVDDAKQFNEEVFLVACSGDVTDD